MSGSYDDVSLVVLDGAQPSQYAPWSSASGGPVLLSSQVDDLDEIEPWISEENRAYDGYRFGVLFETPGELRRRSEWTRVAGCIVDAVAASRNPGSANDTRKLLKSVCTSLVNNAVPPWFRIVGFHLVCIVASDRPTPGELSFRDELVDIVELHLNIHLGRGLVAYEAASAKALRMQMVLSTTRMVEAQRYWKLAGKRIPQYETT